MSENRRNAENGIRMPPHWLDTAWYALASRWAIVTVLGAWLVLFLVCAWVPQENPVAGTGRLTAVRWLAAVQADRLAMDRLLDQLGLLRVWDGWVVRVLQGLTAAWLALLAVGDASGWLVAASQSVTVRPMDMGWDEARQHAVNGARTEGWRVLRSDDDVIVMRACKLDGWRCGLTRALWAALLLFLLAWRTPEVAPQEGLTIPLAFGERAHVGWSGIEAVRLERLQFRLRPDGTPSDLAGDLAVLLSDGVSHRVRITPGRAARLGDTAVRVVGTGPVLRLSAHSSTGEPAGLASMSGTEAAADVLRVRLGGVNQEHLVAMDQGKATLRLVEGATGLPNPWAVLTELLDGYTGASLGRQAMQPPGTAVFDGYVVTLASEYYVEIQLVPGLQPIRRLTDVIAVMALVVALLSLGARWRWHPENAAIVISRAGSQSRCAFLALPAWGSELAGKLGCEGSEESV
jgi:hypothetical protein